MLPLSGLLFVRRRDRAQVFHHAHAKRRSRQRLTKCTDARLAFEPKNETSILEKTYAAFFVRRGQTLHLATSAGQNSAAAASKPMTNDFV
jgi:hypothetical protein